MLDIAKISIICFAFYILGSPGMIFDWYQKLINPLPEWLWKPLGGCLKCFTGQAAFHYYWITHLKNYNIVDQLFYPSMGILIAILLNYLYEHTQKD